MHRDLKPQNILLVGGIARISDFGMDKNFQMAGLSEAVSEKHSV